MVAILEGSPRYLAMGEHGDRVCALSGERCSVPYVRWEMDDGDDIFVAGCAVSKANVAGIIAAIIARQGVWARLDKVEVGLIADVLALAYAADGGLRGHSVLGQQIDSLFMPEELCAPVESDLDFQRGG
jgi:hypothetical protein